MAIGAVCVIIGYFGLLGSESSKGAITCLGILAVGILSFALFFVGIARPEQTRLCTTETIMCLEDNTLKSGKRSMYSGNINGQQYYVYMVDLGDNTYVQNKILATGTKVHYTDKTPKVEWYETYIPFLGKDNVSTTYQVVYIPEGSISNNHSIDCK